MNLADLFSNYFEVRDELVEAVKDLTPEQLVWQPKNHPNSIGWSLAHIAETECWWIQCVVQGLYERPSKSEFEVFDSMPALLELLDKYRGVFEGYLKAESTDDWDDVSYLVKKYDKHVSKRWLAWHVVEHQARHRGQIFMLMRMQGLTVPHV